MESIKAVTLGAAHTCCKCPTELPKGSVAVRRSRPAATARERCHADGRGQVQWYYCPRHAPPVSS